MQARAIHCDFSSHNLNNSFATKDVAINNYASIFVYDYLEELVLHVPCPDWVVFCPSSLMLKFPLPGLVTTLRCTLSPEPQAFWITKPDFLTILKVLNDIEDPAQES